MDVIVFEKETYWKMQSQLMQMFRNALTEATRQPDDWIPTEQAKALLGVKSKSKMQQLRSTGAIGFSKHGHKSIMYSRQSILDYLNQNVPEAGNTPNTKTISLQGTFSGNSKR